MAATHDELLRMISSLDADVPGLLAAHPQPSEFWAAFNVRAGAIQAAASPDDHAWICERLDALLERCHLVPPADQI